MSKRFLPRSLRWRLQLWLAFLLVCVLTGFGVTVFQLQKVNRFGQIDGELETRIAALTAAYRELYVMPRHDRPPDRDDRRLPPDDWGPRLGSEGREGREFDGPGFDRSGRRGPPPDFLKRFEQEPFPPGFRKPSDLQLPPEAAALFGNRSGDYYYVAWFRDGSVLKRSANAPPGLTRPEPSERDTLPHFRTRQEFREALDCSGLGDCVLTGRSVEADLLATRNFAWALLAAGGAVLALGLGLGFWFTTRAIRPIETISAAASRISHGNLSERVEGADSGDELGSLAEVLNSTFARLEAAFDKQKQFTADAAHELRTPLAVIISETQTALARDRGAAEYRETVEGCLEVAQQMRRLTESLLALARFDAGETPPRAEVDVARVARVAVERIAPYAEQRKIKIETGLAPARAIANADRLSQVITNLLTNAIDYNKPNGTVRVATGADAQAIRITVSDTGVGIADHDIEHIFDRFYRVDKSRSRAEGHTGLGLAISKAIIEAEGGTIAVESSPGEGTKFTVTLVP